jgi:putative cardiolipin synthase
VLAALLMIGAGIGCAYPSKDWKPAETRAFEATAETSLGQELVRATASHPGLSAVYPLGSGLDAFAARLVLIERAQRAIDFQYYILHRDVTGEIIMSRLLAAADRGVRVRVLVDDVGSGGVDDWLPALAVHPNVEVRYFNPFARGAWPGLARFFDGIARAGRINHRMHNKLLTADGAAAVVGGRNIGDEYFDAAESVNFADLDLLAAGPVLTALGESFDLYWNSPYAIAPEAWSRLQRTDEDLEALRAEFDAHAATQAESKYVDRVSGTKLLQELAEGRASSHWAKTTAVADLPSKIDAPDDEVEQTLLIKRMAPLLPAPQRELIVVSAYFVPGERGVEHLVGLARAGVRVAVLTNSLAATDVTAVHAGYERYRDDLLEGGVELYEFKPSGSAVDEAHASGHFGSSGASLHAKTFIYDRKRVFVGSLNLDPRSVDLNTELGLVVESEELAQAVAAGFERGISSELSWRVSLDADGDLVWDSTDAGVPVHHTSEPDASCWRRFCVWFLGWLPIESQL